MKYLWQKLGNLAYFIGFPLIKLILNNSERTRVLITSGDKVLVVKSWLGKGNWELPGGGLHKNELKKDGAIREVLEETGIRLKSSELDPVGSLEVIDNGVKLTLNFFKTELSELLLVKKQLFEIVDYKWLNWTEVTQSNSSPDLYRLVKEHLPRRTT